MYVISPFTSLLVLEDEAMYKQFNVDRGRKDHWALYPAPGNIQVVHEPGPALPEAGAPVDILKRRLKEQNARRDVAAANLELGRRDKRNPAELAKLKSLLTREERNRELLKNRLEIVKEAESRKSTNVASTVLYRRPLTFSVTAAYVKGLSICRGIPVSPSGVLRLSLALPTANTWSIPNDEYLNYCGVQPGHEYFDWGEVEFEGDAEDSDYRSAVFTMPLPYRVTGHWNASRLKDHPALRQRTARYEMAYRMQPGGEPVDPRILSGFDQRGWSSEGFKRRFRRRDVELSFTRQRQFDVDLSDVVYGGQSSWEARPDAWFAEASTSYVLTDLPTNRHRIQSLPVFDGFINPEFESLDGRLGTRWVDGRDHTTPGGLKFVTPRFTRERSVFNCGAQNLNLPTEMSGGSTSTRASIPVVHYYRQQIEGRYDESEWYGRAPILDDYDYISLHSPDTSVDEIIQFEVLTEALERDFALESQRGLSSNALGMRLTRRTPGRINLNSIRRPTQSLLSQIVPLPIRRPGILRNLLSYAPAMQTSHADILAVVEAETETKVPLTLGTVDDGAKALVNQARNRGSETIEFAGDDDTASRAVLCNGAGDLRLERITQDRLVE
jgi:hypothetical protein